MKADHYFSNCRSGSEGGGPFPLLTLGWLLFLISVLFDFVNIFIPALFHVVTSNYDPLDFDLED